MKVSDLYDKLGLKLLTESTYNDREITGCYTGDLLSWVMSHAEQGNVWITIMNNVNITAVASLCDVACVVLAEGVGISDEILKKANENEIVIFTSDKSAYELCGMIYKEESVC